MERTYSHIDLDESRKIARWRTAGLIRVLTDQNHLPILFVRWT